ncbi:MAG: GNAT family N-acetyltransferase [Pseudomonadota bacterium]
MTVSIKPLEPHHEADWRRLWSAYLDFYKVDLPASETDALFESLATGAPHFALVAETEGAYVGFVHALPHASTWSRAGYCYLEDLYVDPSARGARVGRTLIEAVYAEADARGLTRVYWHTDRENARARRLYDSLASVSEFIQYRRQ